MKKIRLLKDFAHYKAGDVLPVEKEGKLFIWLSDEESTDAISKELLGVLYEHVAYIIIQDEDSHWYLIEKKDRNLFETWVDDTSNYRESSFDFDDCRIPGYPANFITILDYEEK